MYRITVSEKGGPQSTFDFEKAEITIGRMKGNDIVLPKGNVSKRHSQISVSPSGSLIRDLGSTNGTFVNGRRIQGDHVVHDADKIFIGDFILRLELSAVRPPPPMRPPNPPTQPANNVAAESMTPSGNQPNPIPGNPSSGFLPSNTGSGFNPVQENGSGFLPEPIPSSSGFNPVQENGSGFLPEPIPSSSGFNPVQENGSGFIPSPTPSRGSVDLATSANKKTITDFNQNMPAQEPSIAPAAMTLPAPDAPLPEPIKEPFGLKATEQAELGNVSSISFAYENMHNDLDLEPQRIPVFTETLDDKFNASFHVAHIAATDLVLKSINKLPQDYPPKTKDLSKYKEIVATAVKEIKDVDKEKLSKLLVAECIGLGPIEALLDDPDVFEIFVHKYDQIFIRKSGNLVRHQYCFGSPDLLEIATQRLLGKTNNDAIQHARFEDGTKVMVTRPPLSQNPILTLIKPRDINSSLADLIESKSMPSTAAAFLKNAVRSGRSILIAGPQHTGKTTILSALASEIPSGERIVAIEETPNLNLPIYAIRLEDGIKNSTPVIEAALQMQPNRILIDSLTATTSYQWINAVASGTIGSLGTLFATSPHDALEGLESMAILGNQTLSPRGIREQITRAVDLIVVLHREKDGFRIQQISELVGVDFDAYRLQSIFHYQIDGTQGSLHPTGYIPPFYEDLKHSGFDIDFNIFRE